MHPTTPRQRHCVSDACWGFVETNIKIHGKRVQRRVKSAGACQCVNVAASRDNRISKGVLFGTLFKISGRVISGVIHRGAALARDLQRAFPAQQRLKKQGTGVTAGGGQ